MIAALLLGRKGSRGLKELCLDFAYSYSNDTNDMEMLNHRIKVSNWRRKLGFDSNLV